MADDPIVDIDCAFLLGAITIMGISSANNLLNDNAKTKHHFYVSNYTKSFEKSAKFFFREDLKLEEVNLWA